LSNILCLGDLGGSATTSFFPVTNG